MVEARDCLHVRKCYVYEKGNIEDYVAKLPCRTGPSKLPSQGGTHTCVGINGQVPCWVMCVSNWRSNPLHTDPAHMC